MDNQFSLARTSLSQEVSRGPSLHRLSAVADLGQNETAFAESVFSVIDDNNDNDDMVNVFSNNPNSSLDTQSVGSEPRSPPAFLSADFPDVLDLVHGKLPDALSNKNFAFRSGEREQLILYLHKAAGTLRSSSRQDRSRNFDEHFKRLSDLWKRLLDSEPKDPAPYMMQFADFLVYWAEFRLGCTVPDLQHKCSVVFEPIERAENLVQACHYGKKLPALLALKKKAIAADNRSMVAMGLTLAKLCEDERRIQRQIKSLQKE